MGKKEPNRRKRILFKRSYTKIQFKFFSQPFQNLNSNSEGMIIAAKARKKKEESNADNEDCKCERFIQTERAERVRTEKTYQFNFIK